MRNDLRAECMKQKRSFTNKIIWLVPLVTLLLAYFIMGPWYLQVASYNWWYILFLPFTFTYIAASVVKKERKYLFHGMFGIVEDKKKLWYAKIFVSSGYLLLACLIFGVLSIIGGFLCYEQISVGRNLAASILLTVTFAWQIPFFMLLTLKCGMILSLVVSVFCNLVLACMMAVGNFWWMPFAIPARIMCPVIRILPNGLLLEEGSSLSNPNVIIFGVVISLILYVAGTFISARVFEKQEA